MERVSRIATVEVSARDSVRTWLFFDPHFDHENIIKYCNRPFGSVTEMNTAIWTNWNKVIRPDDLVVFGGDMAFGRGSRKPKWWLEQLNGRIIYLKGSHDHGIRPTSEGLPHVLFVADAIVLKSQGVSFLVIHDPSNAVFVYPGWNGWKIHGHVHNNRPHIDIRRKCFNVSAEVVDYKPRNLYYFVDLLESFDSA